MSAICGIYHLDHKPLCIDTLGVGMDALADYGADGSDAWCAGAVGLGHQMTYTTPESLFERLPLKMNNLVITADARLDNRESLCDLLDISHTDRGTITDSQLILYSYGKWGEDCPTHLLGDFAFAIWDGDRHIIFCARDHLGIRPFYYHLNPDLFVFASDVRGVIAHPDVPRDLNKKSLAMHLRDVTFIHKEMTFFEAVKKLPPSHTLTVSPAGVSLCRYWHPADSPLIRLKDIDAYAEVLRELLHQSVECRLRSAYPVGAHLSGGLDSSTIAVLAARILRKRGGSLPTYNWIHSPEVGEDPDSPEFTFARLVCDQEGLINEKVDLTVEDVFSQLSLDISTHHAVNFWYEPLVQKAAQRQGVRIMLSGWGGDELITFNGRGYYAGLFWGMKWLELARAIHWRGILGSDGSPYRTVRRWIANLYYKVLLPSLPDRLYALVDKEWLATWWADCAALEFAAYIHLHPPLPQQAYRERVGLHANQIALLINGYLTQRIEAWASSGSHNSISYAYPLLDKRIVEFSLRIPPGLYVKDGYARYLFRRAVQSILPKTICWGNLKQEPFRVKRYQEVTSQAARAWLAQAEKVGWFSGPTNPYIDVRALKEITQEGAASLDEIMYVTTLIRSIQVFATSIEHKRLW